MKCIFYTKHLVGDHSVLPWFAILMRDDVDIVPMQAT